MIQDLIPDLLCVFLLGLDTPKVEEWSAEVAKNLIYVAITRAREYIQLCYLHKTSRIEALLSAKKY